MKIELIVFGLYPYPVISTVMNKVNEAEKSLSLSVAALRDFSTSLEMTKRLSVAYKYFLPHYTRRHNFKEASKIPLFALHNPPFNSPLYTRGALIRVTGSLV